MLKRWIPTYLVLWSELEYLGIYILRCLSYIQGNPIYRVIKKLIGRYLQSYKHKSICWIWFLLKGVCVNRSAGLGSFQLSWLLFSFPWSFKASHHPTWLFLTLPVCSLPHWQAVYVWSARYSSVLITQIYDGNKFQLMRCRYVLTCEERWRMESGEWGLWWIDRGRDIVEGGRCVGVENLMETGWTYYVGKMRIGIHR